MQAGLRLAAIVLAAGAGRRFSDRPGAKLLAEVDGRPMLVHVVETVRRFGPAATVVVLGHAAADIERVVAWEHEMRVVNRAPDRGLASSIQVGIHALEAMPGAFDGTFIVLGDQPRVRTEVLEALAGAAADRLDRRRVLIVPRYAAEDGPRNPVLILGPAWPLVDELGGDHGLAPLIDARPDLVLDVPVEGAMPDVDEPGDLERLLPR